VNGDPVSVVIGQNGRTKVVLAGKEGKEGKVYSLAIGNVERISGMVASLFDQFGEEDGQNIPHIPLFPHVGLLLFAIMLKTNAAEFSVAPEMTLGRVMLGATRSQ